jgi:hypothetical protein
LADKTPASRTPAKKTPAKDFSVQDLIDHVEDLATTKKKTT